MQFITQILAIIIKTKKNADKPTNTETTNDTTVTPNIADIVVANNVPIQPVNNNLDVLQTHS